MTFLFLPVLAIAQQSPRQTFVALCKDKADSNRSFTLQISKVMAPKSLCQTKLYISGHEFRTPCEYSPQGLYFVYQEPHDFSRRIMFATWSLIKGQGGELDLEDGFNPKTTAVCTVIGAQG
jgi:hypothetical protein